MPSYFFHVRTPDQTVRAPEHLDLPDLTTALAAAHRTVRKIVRNPIRRAATLRGGLDIENELHQPVARLLFADVAHKIS